MKDYDEVWLVTVFKQKSANISPNIDGFYFTDLYFTTWCSDAVLLGIELDKPFFKSV